MRKDKRHHILQKVDEDLDVRDHWAGIKALKKTHTPQPCNRKDTNCKIVAQESRAETAATYLKLVQLGKTDNQIPRTYPTTKIVNTNQERYKH